MNLKYFSHKFFPQRFEIKSSPHKIQDSKNQTKQDMKRITTITNFDLKPKNRKSNKKTKAVYLIALMRERTTIS